MKQRNYYRVAALLLAVMMTLGLAACGGSGSGGQVDQPQKNDHSANTVWNGLWVGEDEVLQIMSDESIALLFYVETDGFYKGAQNNFDEVYSYSYTIDGNVLKLKNGYAADEGVAPETMELTMNGDRLVSGDKVYIKFTETSGSGQTQQPSVSEPAVQSEPAVTDPRWFPPVSAESGRTVRVYLSFITILHWPMCLVQEMTGICALHI